MIQLRKIIISSGGTIEISIFPSHNEALSHICDHVLTRPESQLWSILLRKYREVVDPTEDRELVDLAFAFWDGRKRDSLQKLYDGYAEAISDDLHFAYRNSWHWEQDHYGEIRYFGIGLHGIRVVWALPTVVSAMLLSDEIRKPSSSVSYNDRMTNPLPRRSSKIIPKVIRADTDLNRYKIFKNSWGIVRSEYVTAFKEKNARGRCEELAKGGIIPFSRWLELHSAPKADSLPPSQSKP